jgi:hypothetical protein
MLAFLEANFKPATFSRKFVTLLSLINDKQADEGDSGLLWLARDLKEFLQSARIKPKIHAS